ncbi:hypothetical protein ABPG75_004046 [Micractinium tetrahymenae]
MQPDAAEAAAGEGAALVLRQGRRPPLQPPAQRPASAGAADLLANGVCVRPRLQLNAPHQASALWYSPQITSNSPRSMQCPPVQTAAAWRQRRRLPPRQPRAVRVVPQAAMAESLAQLASLALVVPDTDGTTQAVVAAAAGVQHTSDWCGVHCLAIEKAGLNSIGWGLALTFVMRLGLIQPGPGAGGAAADIQEMDKLLDSSRKAAQEIQAIAERLAGEQRD